MSSNSDQLMQFSQSISTNIHNMSRVQKNPSQDSKADDTVIKTNLQSLRDRYLEIFNLQSSKKEEPKWWIDVFRNTGDEMVHLMKKDYASKVVCDRDWCVNVKCMDKTYKFKEDHRVIMVGRNHGCDIQLKDRDVSRLHALIYLLPEISKIAIVDVGSLNGIIMTSSSDLSLKRRTVMLDFDEFGKFCVGTIEFAVNMKTCVVCFENLRDLMFDCGHYVACKECSNLLSNCPMCRKPIVTKKVRLENVTHLAI